jgi:hypothetical protein
VEARMSSLSTKRRSGIPNKASAVAVTIKGTLIIFVLNIKIETMSKSNPKIENPCKKFIDYKGDKGQFFFYDKDKEEQIEISIPIYFVVLDELSTINQLL